MPNVISCVIIGKIRTVGNIFKVVFLAIAFNVTSRKFNQRSDYVPRFGGIADKPAKDAPLAILNISVSALSDAV